MKANLRLLFSYTFGFAVIAYAQAPGKIETTAPQYEVTDRGLHHKVWQSVTFYTNQIEEDQYFIANPN
jgi:hypothetical protein